MAKVKVNKAQAEKNLRERFKKASENETLLKDIGETAVKNTRASARLGKDPETGENYPPFQSKNKNGVKRYIARRKQIAKDNGKGRNFKPKKANMTITGQLINSINYKIFNKKVVLEPNDEPRRPYGEETPPSNRDLTRWHQDGAGGYPKRNILGVSEKTEKTIANKVRAFFRRSVLKR